MYIVIFETQQRTTPGNEFVMSRITKENSPKPGPGVLRRFSFRHFEHNSMRIARPRLIMIDVLCARVASERRAHFIAVAAACTRCICVFIPYNKQKYQNHPLIGKLAPVQPNRARAPEKLFLIAHVRKSVRERSLNASLICRCRCVSNPNIHGSVCGKIRVPPSNRNDRIRYNWRASKVRTMAEVSFAFNILMRNKWGGVWVSEDALQKSQRRPHRSESSIKSNATALLHYTHNTDAARLAAEH